jgi:heme exporter protein C
MKILIIISGVTLGIFLGLIPNQRESKPFWWKMLAIFFISFVIILSILPPVAGNFGDAYYLNSLGRTEALNVKINTENLKFIYSEENEYWILQYQFSENSKSNKILVEQKNLPSEFKNADIIIIKTKFNKTKNAFLYLSTEYINPIITLPYIPALKDKIKIMNFHVPCAWIGVLAYLISMIYSIKYLSGRKIEDDIAAITSAQLGTLFTVLALLTGMLWAKFNWGAFWNWDPRQTSIFVLLLIYFAYFALRTSIENRELKARLSSVYSIIAFITVPFLVFILPRMISGLHPGSAGDEDIGPVLSRESNIAYIWKDIIFGLSIMSFSMLYFWMLNIIRRYKLLRENYD